MVWCSFSSWFVADIVSLDHFNLPFVVKIQPNKPSQSKGGPDKMKDTVRIPDKLAQIKLAALTTTSLKGWRIISVRKLKIISPLSNQ